MIWHDLRDSKDPELDALAQRYDLHPLHIEDCRQRDQRAKVEEGVDYMFVVLKPVHINKAGQLEVTDFDLFLGRDYLITVQEGECPSLRKTLDQLRATANHSRADQLFHKNMDATVDAYQPVLDWFNDAIDAVEDKVLEKPSPTTLQRIFELKRELIKLRRVLTNMRDVSAHFQRLETELIRRDLWPFLRDVNDHLARDVEMVEMHRDLLAGAMNIYLSSVSEPDQPGHESPDGAGDHRSSRNRNLRFLRYEYEGSALDRIAACDSHRGGADGDHHLGIAPSAEEVRLVLNCLEVS